MRESISAWRFTVRHAPPKTPQDLQRHICVRLRHANQGLRSWAFEKNKKKVDIEVAGPLIVNDVDLMIKAVRAGIGIGYMAESYIADDIRAGRLLPLLTDWSTAYDSWYLYYTGRHHLPTPLKVFIAFLREYLNR